MRDLNSQKNTISFLKYGVFLFAVLIGIDQFSKSFIKNPFLNDRFAFSLPIPTNLIYVIYVLVITSIIYYIVNNYKNFSNLTLFSWILILAGAFSNIGERIIFGSVKDWIYLLNGIFNLADFYIILGILILLLQKNKVSSSQVSKP
jgi:lipoprotein signal peptidase